MTDVAIRWLTWAGQRQRPRRRRSSILQPLAVWIALSNGVGLASRAAAQEPADTAAAPDTVFTLEEISVRVARPVATAGGASAITARLDSLRTPPSPTLEDVLREMPLVLVRENSRGEAQPTVRGMESRRIAVLVDGVPITLGWDDRADLSVVPLSAARELTLVRGLSSVLHGPNAAGGVVLIGIADGPIRAPRSRPLQLTVGVDHLGNTAAALGLAGVLRGDAGDLLLRAGGGYRDRSGVPLPSNVQEAVAGADDERLNSDLQHANGYLVARYQDHDGPWVALSSFGFLAEKGVPPELHIAEPRLWRYPRASRWVTALSAGSGWQGTPWGEGDLELSLGLDFGETEIDTYESLAYDVIDGGESGDDRTLSLRLLGDHTLSHGILRGALTLAETRHKELIEPDERATYRQRLWSFGLEAEQPFLAGDRGAPRARVSLGASIDGADTPETGGRTPRDAIWAWGARAGGTLALRDGSVLLNGGLSRRVRFPALRELYSGALGKFVVNENLDPEVLIVAEFGVTAGLGPVELQAVSFFQRLADAIVRVGLGDGRLQRQNRDEIRSLGLELLASYRWRRLSLSGDLTLQDVALRDPSAPDAQLQPEYQPSINAGLGASAPLALGVWGSVRARHVGRRYCVDPDLERAVRLSADTWLDLELGRGLSLGGAPVGRRLEATFALDNFTDAAVFDQCGLPQPGRLLRLQVRLF